ncbi:hypothetical protein C8Q77DRAFT_1119273 [Trametes polyzona]|nr:hypothetical protein C8Q77DRAFT_1119273 [Trametes polyzona]
METWMWTPSSCVADFQEKSKYIQGNLYHMPSFAPTVRSYVRPIPPSRGYHRYYDDRPGGGHRC